MCLFMLNVHTSLDQIRSIDAHSSMSAALCAILVIEWQLQSTEWSHLH